MKSFNVKISVINPDYNPEYAKEYAFLERDYENPKFDSEVSFQIPDVTAYKYKENTSYLLQFSKNHIQQECILNNVCVLELLSNKQPVSEFVLSQTLISSTRAINKKSFDKGYFYFYLKPEMEYVQLSKTIYIANSEVPEEFK